jgi:hypothetical protein
MTKELILSKLHQLPEPLQAEVLHYVEFLESRYGKQGSASTRKKRVFGSAKGKYRLAPDFNAPLDDFKDDM